MRLNRNLYKILILFFVTNLDVHTESVASSHNALERVLFNQLNDQAEKMNVLISHYQTDGVLSAAQQKNYAQTLVDFKNEMEELVEYGYPQEKVDQYNIDYTDVYEQYAKNLIFEPSLQAEIAQAGRLQNLKHVSDSSSDISDVHAQKIVSLYQSLQDSIIESQQVFNKQVLLKIENLGTYSVQSKKDFLNLLHNEFASFVAVVNAEKVSIKNDYFTFLTHQNPQFTPQDLNDHDHNFLHGVDELVQNSISCQRVFMLEITTKTLEVQALQNLNESLKQADAANEKDYHDQVLKNEKGLNRSWWEELKAEGKDLLSEFSKEFTQEVTKQTQKILIEQGTKVAEAVGKNIADNVTSSIARLSKKINLESVSEFVKDLAPATRILKSTIRTMNPVTLPTSPVNVVTSLDLCSAEKTFVHNRLAKIQPILQKEFEISEPLIMAFCCSGGGNRAMIGTMGILQAAAKSKILQSCMYMAGLSGSTWLIAPWSYLYTQGNLDKDFEVSLQQIVQNWTTVLNDKNMVLVGNGMFTPACLTGQQATTFSQQVAIRLAYDEPISAVDLYGAMVGNFALDLAGANKLKVTWSSIDQKLQKGDIPLPLCSAVFDNGSPSPKKTKEHKEYDWFEFSPFQCGSTQLGYVSPQYLGSRFVSGKLDIASGQLCHEYPLNFILGVCGSAFSINLDDAVDKGLPNVTFNIENSEITLPIDTWIRSLLDESLGSDVRGKRSDTRHARFFNFSRDLPTSILKNEEIFGLFDAGINFNFPLPVLLDRPDRQVDLVFIYDSNPANVPTFKDAAAYYKRKGNVVVPDMSKVTQKGLMAHTMTVFNDPRKKGYDSKVPTFLYFPTRGFDIKKSPYITTNFKYTQEQMEKLINGMDNAFISQVPEIKKIMKLVAKARHAQ